MIIVIISIIIIIIIINIFYNAITLLYLLLQWYYFFFYNSYYFSKICTWNVLKMFLMFISRQQTELLWSQRYSAMVKLFLSVVNVEEKLHQHEQCNILSTCSLTVTSNKRKVFLSGNIHFILPLIKFVH